MSSFFLICLASTSASATQEHACVVCVQSRGQNPSPRSQIIRAYQQTTIQQLEITRKWLEYQLKRKQKIQTELGVNWVLLHEII